MRTICFRILVLLLASTFATTSHAEETERAYHSGDPVLPGYHIESRYQWGYIAMAGIDFAVPYGFSVYAAVDADFTNQSGWLLLPVFGPWVTLITRTPNRERGGSDAVISPDSLVKTGLIVDGIFQTIGAAGLVILATSPEKLVVPDRTYATTVAPYVSLDGGGLRLVGRF